MEKQLILLPLVLLVVLQMCGTESTEVCLLYNLSDYCSDKTQVRGACDYFSTGELCYEIRLTPEKHRGVTHNAPQLASKTKRSMNHPDLFTFHLGELVRERGRKI